MGRPALDFTNARFGDWVVISKSDDRKGKYVQWLCRCKCGTEKLFISSHISSQASKMCSPCANRKTGATRKRSVSWKSPTYRTWANMKSRCLNPNNPKYNYYGGRGISLSPTWHSFDDFLKDMGERPDGTTLDRIDVDADYSKENCRWADSYTQANNRRSNRYIDCLGKRLTVAEWSRLTGINRVTIVQRIDAYGWTKERALGYVA